MKIAQPFECDECHQMKKPSNGWFIAFNFGKQGPPLVTVNEWSDSIADTEGAIHLCGVECVTKRVAKIITTHQQTGEITPDVPIRRKD